MAHVRYAVRRNNAGQAMSWRPSELRPIVESEFVCGILGQWELAARLAASDATSNVESDGYHLVRQGYPLESCPEQPPTREQIEAIIKRTDTEIENGKTIARAWLRIRTHILAALQAEGGEQLLEPGEVPPTVRRPRHDEREPIALPSIEVVEQVARDNGIFQEDTSEQVSKDSDTTCVSGVRSMVLD